MRKTESKIVRCPWAGNELSIPYHDEEWGVPVHDERTWFEFLILEGAQAGLSWDTILKKRARYREVFDGFDPKKSPMEEVFERGLQPQKKEIKCTAAN